MIDESVHPLSRRTIAFDGAFLALVGGVAMCADAVGHFVGAGPMAASLRSPYSIGAFEAHGLALIIGLAMLYAPGLADSRFWHGLGLSVHLLLGSANLLFWTSFVQLDLVTMGVVTTAFHALFIVMQARCLGHVRLVSSPADGA